MSINNNFDQAFSQMAPLLTPTKALSISVCKRTLLALRLSFLFMGEATSGCPHTDYLTPARREVHFFVHCMMGGPQSVKCHPCLCKQGKHPSKCANQGMAIDCSLGSRTFFNPLGIIGAYRVQLLPHQPLSHLTSHVGSVSKWVN